jgi:hypothetical protein
VTGLKLVGRGGPTEAKLAAVKTVRRILEFAESGADGEAVKNVAKAAYKELFGRACGPYVCYFPELWGRHGKAVVTRHKGSA